MYLVEDCEILTPKMLLNALKYASNGKPSVLLERQDIQYWLDDTGRETKYFISINSHKPQELAMETFPITYGEKQFFICGCGHRASKLYLLPKGSEWKCRLCHNLRYQLWRSSKYSIAGRKIYQFSRLQKLSETRADMSRIFYNGHFTKRFERFLRLCARAGLNSVVQDAESLRNLVGK